MIWEQHAVIQCLAGMIPILFLACGRRPAADDDGRACGKVGAALLQSG